MPPRCARGCRLRGRAASRDSWAATSSWSRCARQPSTRRRGRGQIVAIVGEPGVGKSRLLHEFIHSHHSHGWLVLEASSVSYGKATPFLPVIDLLRAYLRIEDRDDARNVRAKTIGTLLALDRALEDVVPAITWLLDALEPDDPFLMLEPAQRRQRAIEGIKRLLLRESRVAPLLVVFEDLHWIDAETQAVLDSLVGSLPTAPILLAVNYRPEYRHDWGTKTYYRQLRIDPLPPESADELLGTLLGSNPSVQPLKAAADRADRRQSAFPRRERAHARGVRRSCRRSGQLSAGQSDREHPGAGDSAGNPSNAHRSAAARAQAIVAGSIRHRQGCAIRAAGRNCGTHR